MNRNAQGRIFSADNALGNVLADLDDVRENQAASETTVEEREILHLTRVLVVTTRQLLGRLVA